MDYLQFGKRAAWILLFLGCVYPCYTQTIFEIDVTGSRQEIRTGHLKLGGTNFLGESISVNNYYLQFNHKSTIPVTGEFHYSRYPNKYWDESIRKMKAGGIDVIATYVFWNIHEECEGVFDWGGDKNLRKFIELCAKNKVRVIVRIGPFCHGEIRNGGLPDWLLGRAVNIRSNDIGYLLYVEKLYNQIGIQLEGLLFKDGGPVIGVQLENEFQHSAAPWGLTYPGQPYDFTTAEADRDFTKAGVSISETSNPYAEMGNEHMKVLKALAIKAGLEVPVYTVTGWGNAAVIENESLPVTAAYAYPTWASQALSGFYRYTDLQKDPDYAPVRYKAEDYPCFAAEISGGIMINYHRRPTVPAESLDALINRFLGSGANGIGYYMFHGGSTPRGKNVFFSDEAYAYPKISYDFQAPIGEYGQIRPSFNRLKLIHFFLNTFGHDLAPMPVILPDNHKCIDPENTEELRYAIRSIHDEGYIFMLNFQDHVESKNIDNFRFKMITSQGVLDIPQKSSLTLKAGENAIFPFNLDLKCATLRYATAQPLINFMNKNEAYLVFFSIDGIEAEFSIYNKPDISFENINCTIMKGNDCSLVKFEKDKPGQLTIKNSDGTNTNLLVIDKELALKSWIIDIGGEPFLAFSNAVVLQNGQSVELFSRGNFETDLDIYPFLKAVPKSNQGHIDKIDKAGDLFTKFQINMPVVEISPVLDQISAYKYALTLPSGKPRSLNDLILQIDYLGDTGMGFLSGELVCDDFYYGNKWEIGLRKFMDMPGSEQMVFYFRPLFKAAPFLNDLPAPKPDFSQTDKIFELINASFIPEYKINLDFN